MLNTGRQRNGQSSPNRSVNDGCPTGIVIGGATTKGTVTVHAPATEAPPQPATPTVSMNSGAIPKDISDEWRLRGEQPGRTATRLPHASPTERGPDY